jgi:flagellar assembly protein FliH
VKEGRELSIRVHPDDLPVLQQEQDRIAAALSGRSFSIVPDARVQVGGCIAESSLGSLDGRLEVQLREIFATLRSVSASVETR